MEKAPTLGTPRLGALPLSGRILPFYLVISDYSIVTVQWTHGVRLRKHLANRNCTVFHWSIARQGGVNACALARRAGGIHSVVVVIANLRHKLGFQHIAVADSEARRHGIAVHDRHLEAVCAA